MLASFEYAHRRPGLRALRRLRLRVVLGGDFLERGMAELGRYEMAGDARLHGERSVGASHAMGGCRW